MSIAMQILRFPLVVTILTLVGGACTPGPATPYTLSSGFIADTPDDIGLTVFDLKGKPITELPTLGLIEGKPWYVHVAGHWKDSGPAPLVFYAFENGDRTLLLNINNTITPLTGTRRFFKLAGAPGQPLLAYSQSVCFPLLPQSDRGAGSAVFSPDNRYVAWMEGSGHWIMRAKPTFQAYVRIASTSGEIITEFPVSAINSIGGVTHVFWMEPVGWLDEQTLILQIGPNAWNPVALARINYDGSGLAYLAPGIFAGFLSALDPTVR